MIKLFHKIMENLLKYASYQKGFNKEKRINGEWSLKTNKW